MSDDFQKHNPLGQYRETHSRPGGLLRAKHAMQLEPQNEHEEAEFAAARKLGHRRLGRWMNDRLLRRLAGKVSSVTALAAAPYRTARSLGPMTAQDMVDLCSPPPFGEYKQSALHTALKAAPDLWSRLRNVDSDKEAAMLQSWQAHNSANKRSAAAAHGRTPQQPSAAVQAVQAWHRISKRGRNSLLTMNIERVYVLEDQVLEFLDSEEDERHVEVEDAFERCGLHALADFHGLLSASVDVSTGRSVRLRCSRGRLSSTATCSGEGGALRATVGDASEMSTTGGADAQQRGSETGSPGKALPQNGQSPQAHRQVTEVSEDVPESSIGIDRHEKKEVEDRPTGECNIEGLDLVAGMQLPFTAVDVVAVLQEERQAQAALGRHMDGSLTVAALLAHRQEHFPVEMCRNANAVPS